MIIRKILKWLVGIVITLLILLLAGTFLLNTKSVQQWLLRESTKALSEKLQTNVTADSVSVNLFLLQMSLYGLEVDDRQGRDMLSIQRFDGDFSLKSILNMSVMVDRIETTELDVNIIKERADSAANFQFVIDELAKKSDKESEHEHKDKKSKVHIDFHHLLMNNTRVNYSEPGGKANASARTLDLLVDGDDYELSVDALKMYAKGLKVGKNKIKQVELNLTLQAEASLGDDMEAEIDMENLDFKWPEKNVDIKGLAFEVEADNHTAEIDGLALKFRNYDCRLKKLVASIPQGQKWKQPKNLNIQLDGISVNDRKTNDHIRLDKASASMNISGGMQMQRASASGMNLKFNTAKQTITASLKQAKADRQRGKYAVTLNGIRLTTDNHKPRRNTGKPKRGWFDAGHLDIASDMKWIVDLSNKDAVNAQLSNGSLKDAVAGIDIKNLKMQLTLMPSKAHLKNLSFQQAEATSLSIASADITLPSKKEGRSMSFQTSKITGHVVLADISRPFAQTLDKFKLPLNFITTMSGNRDAIRFNGISVHSDNQQLNVTANGEVTHLREKHKVDVKFYSVNLHAKTGMPETIINQFPVKKLMITQLHKLGNISYSGQFEVVNKSEIFKGVLTTKAGPIELSITIDNVGKWLSGNVSTEALDIGLVFEMENLGDVKADASFKVDISKERTARMRQTKGGKLPIGSVSATVDDCSYKKVHVHDIEMQLESDGAVATGTITDYNKLLDLSCQFSFTDTDQMNKMKVKKAGIRFHKRKKKEKEEEDEKEE